MPDVLSREIAQQIVDRTMAVLGCNVNVMDADGVIIGSGDRRRIGTTHEGAEIAARRDRIVVISQSEHRVLRGSQPGVNVPLHYRGVVIGAVGISGPPEEVRAHADLIGVTAELMVEQAQILHVRQWRERDREEFATAAATGEVDAAGEQEWAAQLGLDLNVPRRCVVIVGQEGRDASGLRVVHQRVGGVQGAMVGSITPHELAVWVPSDVGVRSVVGSTLTRDVRFVRFAQGEVFAGVGALRRTWQSAHDHLVIDTLDTPMYEPRDASLVALLGDLPHDWRREDVAEPWRRLVAGDTHGDLVHTLAVWLAEDCTLGQCAERLHVHRNTLRYRLARIEQLTGLNLRRVPDLMRLYLGPLHA